MENEVHTVRMILEVDSMELQSVGSLFMMMAKIICKRSANFFIHFLMQACTLYIHGTFCSAAISNQQS